MIFIKRFLGIFFLIEASVSLLLISQTKSEQPVFIVLFVICAILAILLLRKTKKDKQKILAKQTKSNKVNTFNTLPQKQVITTPTSSKPKLNPKFGRTKQEEELEFIFFNKHFAKSDVLCDEFLDLAHKTANEDDILPKIELLQQTINAFYRAKDWHYNHSKGGMLWFQDNWEYCHNSKNSCFSWIDSIQENLIWYKKAKDIVIPWIIKNAEQGFLQTEIYKAFPTDNKASLRNIIDNLYKKNHIKKVKQKNTYFITLANVNS